ncbi:MAG TPA: hypothetical protein VLQ80_33715 [Candidatus Saccharimonadia bacterium]|nr:hypothetical protein [Candidatus Saccharimonadia bacterium]
MDEFLREILEKRVVEIELPFEGAIGHAPSALEHGNRLVQNLLEGHGQPSSAARGLEAPHPNPLPGGEGKESVPAGTYRSSHDTAIRLP